MSCAQAVYIIPLPHSSCNHGCAHVDEDAPCKHAGQRLFDFDVHLAQLPLHQTQVPLNACDTLLSLHLGVEADGYPQVFDLGCTGNTCYILDGVLGQNL